MVRPPLSKKGSQVYVEGSLQTRKWQGQDGQDRYTTEIKASEMQMLGGRQGGGASTGYEAPAASQPAAAPRQQPAAKPAPSAMDAVDDFEDDIPF